MLRLSILITVCICFAAPAAAQELIAHPSLGELEKGLRGWAKEHPRRIQLETIGTSGEGRPLLMAKVTDFDTTDEDKQVVLFSVTHADELSAATGLLHFTKWLVGNDPQAAKIRKQVVALVIPVVNPDGYAKWSKREADQWICHKTIVGKTDPWPGWTKDGPVKPKMNPELVALFNVVEKYRPDASFDIHGVWFRDQSMWESTDFSWTDRRVHSYCPDIPELMNRAAEKAGYLILRPAEDSGRIKVTAPDPDSPAHYYCTGGRRSFATFLYDRYHTLALNCEAGYEGSVVARARKLLEIGLEKWRNEPFAGYPVNQVGGWGSMTVSAWGDTAARRRASRVELWRNTDRIFSSLVFHQSAYGKMAAVCATNVPAAEKWIGDGKLPGVWDRLESHAGIDAKYLKAFSQGTLWERVDYPMWYNRKNKSTERIKNGLAVRLYVPYPDARLTDVRIDGKMVGESSTDGYVVRRNAGTIVQFNIPPGKVGDIHVVNCQYEAQKKTPRGFRATDW